LVGDPLVGGDAEVLGDFGPLGEVLHGFLHGLEAGDVDLPAGDVAGGDHRDRVLLPADREDERDAVEVVVVGEHVGTPVGIGVGMDGWDRGCRLPTETAAPGSQSRVYARAGDAPAGVVTTPF